MGTNRAGLVQQFQRWCQVHSIESGDTLIAAVSGGLDSMVLAEVLHRTGRPLHIAHVNYGLRGADSDADEALVVAWCAERAIPCHVHRADMSTLQDGVQATARRIRYAHFESVRSDLLAENNDRVWVALAHHGDDQAETVLLHLMRSADPMALASMPAIHRDRHLMRPFLGNTRAQLAQFAEAWSVPFREDASNAKPDYLRNRIRHEVLPLLEDLRPGTVGHVAHWAERFGPLRTVLSNEVQNAKNRCWTEANSSEGTLDLVAWRGEPLRGEILFQLAASFGIASKAVPELAALTEAHVASGAHFSTASARVERRGKALVWNRLT